MCHAQLRGSQPQDLLKLLAQIKLRWTCSLPARLGAGLSLFHSCKATAGTRGQS